MKELFVPYELAVRLKEKGFEEGCFGWYAKDGSFYTGNVSIHQGLLLAPLYQQVVNWLDNLGYNIKITPEYYYEGINWNWQVLWYLPQTQWSDRNIVDGTMMHGDNGEYSTRLEAITAAIEITLTYI